MPTKSTFFTCSCFYSCIECGQCLLFHPFSSLETFCLMWYLATNAFLLVDYALGMYHMYIYVPLHNTNKLYIFCFHCCSYNLLTLLCKYQLCFLFDCWLAFFNLSATCIAVSTVLRYTLWHLMVYWLWRCLFSYL